MSLTSTTNTGPLYIIIAVIAILSCILTLGLFLFSCIIKQNESIVNDYNKNNIPDELEGGVINE